MLVTFVNFLYSGFLRIILSAVLIIISLFSIQGQELSEKASVSVLTCAPGNELYSVFGHTAIRVSDPKNEIDLVFNYGTFDFNTSFFYLKFGHGNLDYLLSVTSFKNFLREYFVTGRTVWQQELNLTKAQKDRLFRALMFNARPENRAYRYDFFYDNCATRVADIIIEQLPGNIYFETESASTTALTFRKAIHPYLEKKTWTKTGIDLILGAKADSKTDSLTVMFLPDFLMEQFAGIKYQNSDGNIVDLVKSQSVVLDFTGQDIPEAHSTASPSLIFWGLFGLILFLSFAEVFGTVSLRFFDVALYLIAGIAGIVISYLAFISNHSVTNPNWNLLWANPLWLVLITNVKTIWITFVKNVLVILLFVFFVSVAFLPQYIPNEFIAVSLILFLRSSPGVVKWSLKRMKLNLNTNRHDPK
ncbi:Lnb N-terminal periplasmic domain-containing protein [Anaerophaga thermohalophila]|uniref:Lnb N-terminal periplasmic domain-containing protein n=1 Tax=Anaerophaga thermohalophila TaxID=177400 RepID=UPI00031BD28F|nr:DUF4105 domain-containing protein [Anaerophaga thermohalophila]